MKIVFCGPPHSGKSVFIANLIDKLPTDAYTIIRACPDGEGTWSNNKNQNETSIVLSSDEEKKHEWLEFGQNLGLECVGCLDSSLEGQEEIYTRQPYFQGKIVGLERGKILDDSQVIKGIVSDLVQKSKYGEKTEIGDESFEGTMLDDTELGFELGYGKEIETEDGTPIKKVRWSEQAIPQIYQAVQEKINPTQPVKINVIRANFILSAICKVAKKQGVTDISAYDIRTKQYIPIKSLPKKRGLKQSEGLAYNVIENKDSIFMDIDITKEQYSIEDYQKCIVPQLKEGKNLYLSGRIPLWLLASISNSYDSSKIFTFQPGKGFTCVSSIDEKDLGTIVDGVDGININQYFEDKKDKSKTKLPAVVEKPSILSKLKGLFNNIRENREKQKYLDPAIKANNITPVASSVPSKNSFQAELQQNVPQNSQTIGQTVVRDTQSQDMSKSDIGG